jgi:hypothetical protein
MVNWPAKIEVRKSKEIFKFEKNVFSLKKIKKIVYVRRSVPVSSDTRMLPR